MRLPSHSIAFTVLLGALAALPPLSIDMGLPALPLLGTALGATPSQQTLTLSLFLIGFAGPQLLLGPLSDRIGRRPVLLWGLALYCLAGVACAMAQSIDALLTARVVQGIGAAGATTLALAIVRDLFHGPQARIKISTITMVFSVAPIVAPTLGAIMVGIGGWQGLYGLLALSGAVLFGVVFFGLAETRPPELAGVRLNLAARYGVVLRHRRCVGYVLTTALNFGGLFAFVAGSPLVLMGDLRMSMTEFGVLFAVTSFGILAGSWFNGWLAARDVDTQSPLGWGLWLSLGAAMVASLMLAAGLLALVSLVPFILVASFCRGMVSPNAAHAVLEPVPAHAGVASALIGCSQTTMGAISGVVIALLYPALGPVGMTLAMAMFSAGALAAWRWAEAEVPIV
jgi:DHA1 family bicyclomycin/chloramphenicol resistance-like MFS transporter